MKKNTALNGGCFYLIASNLRLAYSLIDENMAQEGGVFFIIQKSSLHIVFSTVSNNIAYDGSTLFTLANQGTELIQSSIRHTTFKNNWARQNMINLKLTNLLI